MDCFGKGEDKRELPEHVYANLLGDEICKVILSGTHLQNAIQYHNSKAAVKKKQLGKRGDNLECN